MDDIDGQLFMKPFVSVRGRKDVLHDDAINPPITAAWGNVTAFVGVPAGRSIVDGVSVRRTGSEPTDDKQDPCLRWVVNGQVIKEWIPLDLPTDPDWLAGLTLPDDPIRTVGFQARIVDGVTPQIERRRMVRLDS